MFITAVSVRQGLTRKSFCRLLSAVEARQKIGTESPAGRPIKTLFLNYTIMTLKQTPGLNLF